MEQDDTMEQRHRMKQNGTGSFGYFWFLHFWLNKKLASEVKNTKNESGPCGTSNRTKSGTSGTDTMGWYRAGIMGLHRE